MHPYPNWVLKSEKVTMFKKNHDNSTMKMLYLFIASFKLTQIHTLYQLFPSLFPHISQLIASVCKLCDDSLNLLELLAWCQCRTSWEILAGWNWRFIGFYWAYQMFSSLYKGVSNTVKDSPFCFMLLNESICLLKVHTQPVGVKVLFQFIKFFIYRDGIIWKPVNFLQWRAKVFPHCNIHVPTKGHLTMTLRYFILKTGYRAMSKKISLSCFLQHYMLYISITELRRNVHLGDEKLRNVHSIFEFRKNPLKKKATNEKTRLMQWQKFPYPTHQKLQN